MLVICLGVEAGGQDQGQQPDAQAAQAPQPYAPK